MNETDAGRPLLGGAALMMACACATATQTAQAVSLTGVAATTTWVHPLFVGAGAALVMVGLVRAAPRAAWLGGAGMMALAAAAFLTPPRVMASSALPWDASQLTGAGLYVVAAVLLGVAIFRAFPTRKPEASAMAIGGAALATGCSCCMFNGALAGTIGTAGWQQGFVHPGAALFWVGMSLVAVGLWRLGGWRAAMWVPIGLVLIRFGPRLLRATGDWEVAGVATRTFAGYTVALAGTLVLLYGFAVAWRSRQPAREPVATEPALGTGTA